MSIKAQLVFNGFLELEYQERQEFLKELKEWQEESPATKLLSRLVEKVELGPLNSVCPCCGR